MFEGPDKTNSVASHRRDDKRGKVDKSLEGELGPLADLIYIEPELQKEHETSTGIILRTPKHQGVPNIGTVLAVGKNIKRCKEGQRVVFKDANAKGFWLNQKAHIPLKEEQIIAVIREVE